MAPGINARPLITAGTLLGIGLGGFVDGILFHQLLQAHNMLFAAVRPRHLVGVGDQHVLGRPVPRLHLGR